jgi:hypothetical protein
LSKRARRTAPFSPSRPDTACATWIAKAVAEDVAAAAWTKDYMFPNVHGEAMTKVDYDNWRKRRFKTAVKKANAKLVKAAAASGEQDPVLIPAGLNRRAQVGQRVPKR